MIRKQIQIERTNNHIMNMNLKKYNEVFISMFRTNEEALNS